MKGKKTPISVIKKFVEAKDGILLDYKNENRIIYITIRCCIDDNIWTAKLNCIMNKNQWCMECCKRNNVRQVEPNKALQLIKEKGFELLTSGIIHYWSDIDLYCPKHDIKWTTKYAHLKSGNSNCKLCGHNVISNDALKKIVEENNAIFVKRIRGLKSTVRNIVLKCVIHDHVWRTNTRDIMKLKRWCYYCAWEARKTPFDSIKAIVEKAGGTLLTENCVGSLTKIDVKCSNGHIWETYFDNINSGYWCPECKLKSQTKLSDIIKELFPDYTVKCNYRGFDWLKMNKKKKHRMEIDIWVPEIKLAIEYDGAQHFQPVRWAKSSSDEKVKKAFSDIKRRDKKKDKLIKQHSNEVEYFIRFDYRDVINRELILSRLKAYKILV